jgi:hypothetical protein
MGAGWRQPGAVYCRSAARRRAEAQQRIPVNETIKLVAEGEAGAVYHDEQNDEWLVDVASKGITLYFDREEFEQLLDLLRQAAAYDWDVKLRRHGLRASGE